MRFVSWIPKATDTLEIFNTYCFSTALLHYTYITSLCHFFPPSGIYSRKVESISNLGERRDQKKKKATLRVIWVWSKARYEIWALNNCYGAFIPLQILVTAILSRQSSYDFRILYFPNRGTYFNFYDFNQQIQPIAIWFIIIFLFLEKWSPTCFGCYCSVTSEYIDCINCNILFILLYFNFWAIILFVTHIYSTGQNPTSSSTYARRQIII